jgi:L-ascorbate metabolism protein UlaG (beta-lactamase superfamily)
MRITWYGHSAFLVEAEDGTRVILDPYRSGAFGGALRYGPIAEPADAVVASHTHDDHGAVDTIPGSPQVLIEPISATVRTVTIRGVPADHDAVGGAERGHETILVLEDAGLRLVHLGDLGHELDQAAIDRIGKTDVLLVPVGGYFTIDAATAARVVDSLAPRIVVPMHYKTDKCDFPIASVEAFLATQDAVVRMDTSTFTVTTADLPSDRTVYVPTSAR